MEVYLFRVRQEKWPQNGMKIHPLLELCIFGVGGWGEGGFVEEAGGEDCGSKIK